MREGQPTAEFVERAFAVHNGGDFDALHEFVAPDIVVERIGGEPPVRGWEAFREFLDPDAFAWQRYELVEAIPNGNKIYIKVQLHAEGARSGVMLETDGWMVWTISDGVCVHIFAALDEAEAKAHAGLGQNDSS